MNDLVEQHCITCEGGIPALNHDEIKTHLGQVPGWSLNNDIPCIEKSFSFKNFYQTMAFVNAVAWVAHQENHHPDIELGYNQCLIKYSTHAVNGLTTNDFICAAKINQIVS